MPVTEEPIMEQPPVHNAYQSSLTERSHSRNDATPTNEHPHGYELDDGTDYSPVDGMAFDSPEQLAKEPATSYSMQSSYGAPDQYDPFNQPYVGQDDSPQEMQPSRTGLRVANVTSSDGDSEWEREALQSLRLR